MDCYENALAAYIEPAWARERGSCVKLEEKCSKLLLNQSGRNGDARFVVHFKSKSDEREQRPG
eukprot:1305815-Amphidinium_carterae.1